MTENKKVTVFKDSNDLKKVLATTYIKQINNFFGDKKKALKFLSGVMSDVSRTPKLLDCQPDTLINSYMIMAQMELMPSGVSGEAYVLPYNSSKNGMQAQFQLGYQGLVTLFYRAGVRSIVAEIVYESDEFDVTNGVIKHKQDPFDDSRGKAKGAYVIVEVQAGGKVSKVMSKKQILNIGEKFSKSFKSSFSPWNEKQDPELWMWRKTVLKQVAKLVPKNETIYKAIAEDNKDSVISDRIVGSENTIEVEEDKFEIAKMMITSMKVEDVAVFEDLKKKISGSDKYTPEEKTKITKCIDERVKEIA